jgi:hypothetical protein
VAAKHVLPVPLAAKEVVALLTSGLTASIGLEQAGRMRTKETVLITAAAGGTGQFAVQLAKAAGNRVLATCGSDDKAQMLQQLGADRTINYKREDLKQVLKTEAAQGVNLIWESVGGEMFQTCMKGLAHNGRLVIIGMMSQYGSGWPQSVSKGLPEMLLYKSASMSGFFLPDHAKHYKRHLQQLTDAMLQGKLRVNMDTQEFRGLEAVAEAVAHLQSGQSMGKVYVQVSDTAPPQSQAKL